MYLISLVPTVDSFTLYNESKNIIGVNLLGITYSAGKWPTWAYGLPPKIRKYIP